MAADDALWDQLARLARSMGDASTLTSTMQSAVEGALRVVPAADAAGISFVHHDRPIDTPAFVGEAARRGDALQYEVGEGPCLQSIRQQETVECPDLAAEDRWPRWSRRAHDELGVRAMMCLQLFVTHETVGALNLYADTAHAFDATDRAAALALAAHVSIAISSARELASLESLAADRVVIAQAEGMLMQRYELSGERAFMVLTQVASSDGRSLLEVASELVGRAGAGTRGGPDGS